MKKKKKKKKKQTSKETMMRVKMNGSFDNINNKGPNF